MKNLTRTEACAELVALIDTWRQRNLHAGDAVITLALCCVWFDTSTRPPLVERSLPLFTLVDSLIELFRTRCETLEQALAVLDRAEGMLPDAEESTN